MTSMTDEGVRRVYGTWQARWYDPSKRLWNDLVASRAERDLSTFLRENLDENKTILELACGTAMNLEKIFSLNLKFKSYLGLDFSPDMLRIARRKFHGYPNVEFRERDITRFDDINDKFDIIICDPPSFSRSKDRIFRIDKDLLDLLALTWSCLESQGYLLLSTNYEGWTQDQFQKLVLKTVSKLDGGAKLCALPPPPVDFVWPAENFETKFLLIRKLAGVDPG